MWQTRMRRPSASTSASMGRSSSQNGMSVLPMTTVTGAERAQAREHVDGADVAGVDDALGAGEQIVQRLVVVAVRVADHADEGGRPRGLFHADRIQAVTDG